MIATLAVAVLTTFIVIAVLAHYRCSDIEEEQGKQQEDINLLKSRLGLPIDTDPNRYLFKKETKNHE